MKILKTFVPALLSIAILFSIFPVANSNAASLDTKKSCVMNVKLGWNLISLGELACGLFLMDNSGSNQAEKFPAYLDMYVYDGSEYIHARLTKQDLQNNRASDSIESAAEKYLSSLTKKATSNKFDDFDDFQRSIDQDIKQNDTQKIKEYAGRLNKEIFTSVWVYNPGKEFNFEYVATKDGNYNDDEIAGMLIIRLLSTDISSSDSSQLMDYIDEMSSEIVRELEREGSGYSSFLKEAVSGKVILDSGWSFLSYSKVLADDNGNLNLNNGNCSISKAYVFDDSAKKWVSVKDAGRSMIGSGMVVYNSGTKCNLAIENSIVSKLKSMLRSGADNKPPVLPNSDSTPPPVLPN